MMDLQTGLVAGIAFDGVSSLTCPDIVVANSRVNHLKDVDKSIMSCSNGVSIASPTTVDVEEEHTNSYNSKTARLDVLDSSNEGKSAAPEKIFGSATSSSCDVKLLDTETEDTSSSSCDVRLLDTVQNITADIHKASSSTNSVDITADIRKDVSSHRISPTNAFEGQRSTEVRKSIASSGIGADEVQSSRSSLSSGDYSSCVSVTSLDDDDDEDYLSSIVINTENQDIRRTTSMDIGSSSHVMANRSASLDDKHPPKNSAETKQENVTMIRVNPGFDSRMIASTEDFRNDLNVTETNRLFNRNYCKRDNVYNKKPLDVLRSSVVNLTSNPGYMKFTDELADETVTKQNNNICSINEVTNEAGVKFIDDEGDSICSSEDISDEDEKDEKSKAPDGGWGWVIVAASFFISCIADGISFSFGLLYIEFLRHFDASSSQTSLIGSLFMSVPLLTGPISSALVDRYGCRIMTIIGGVVAGSGFVASAFQDSIGMMYLTFGLIAGLGLGLCYVTAVVSIAYWFDKKRTLATGLGACGTGFGTVIYARMTSYFIAEYGWRGTVLLLAGTFFNMCVGGALMRDPEWWTIEQGNKGGAGGTSVAGTKSIRGAGSSCGSLSGFTDVEQLRRMLKSGETPEYLLTALATTTAGDRKGEEEGSETGSNKYRSVVNLPTFVRQSEKVPLEVLESLSANRRVFNVILENYPSLLLCRSVSDGNKLSDHVATARVPVTMSVRVEAAINNMVNNNNSHNNNTPPTTASPESPDKCSDTVLPHHPPPAPSDPSSHATKTPDTPPSKAHCDSYTTPPSSKTPPTARHKSILSKTTEEHRDSLPALKKHVSSAHQPTAHYLKNIRVHRNSVMYRGAMLNIHRYRLRASSCPDIYRNSMTTIAKENEEKWYGDMLDLLRGMVDFSMFLELHFLLMSVATILLFTWFIVPYFYLADHVTLNHYEDEQVSSLLMIIGVTNFIGMVGLGWAGDQPWMNVTKTYAFCLVVCGVATMAMPYVTSSYALLACACALFGLFFASSFSFTPVILVQLIPLERFTTAYGLSLMCQGIGSLVGPPLAGWIYDTTRTYDLSFYMAGMWIIVAGVLMAIIPATTNRKIWGDGPMERDKMSLSDNRDASLA